MTLFYENVGVLSQIAQRVFERTQARKKNRSLEALRDLAPTTAVPASFKAALTGGPALIAEIKYASPSQGVFQASANLSAIEVAQQYLASGARALSILTEEDYFHGSLEKLRQVRQAEPNALILRKDFFLEDYQLLEARAIGANAILIIVALLGEERSQQLLETSKRLGLDALVEVHSQDELQIAHRIGATLIGVNNRDLKTLKIDIATSAALAPLLEPGVTYVSESGLKSADEIRTLHKLGYSAFLVGTTLMRNGNPGPALKDLCGNLA